VVGVVTLNDVMSTVMGELVTPEDEEHDRAPRRRLLAHRRPHAHAGRAARCRPGRAAHAGEYDTLAGFLMVMLRRVPRRTDSVQWDGHRFEVMDVDNYRIDQVLVTRDGLADARRLQN
jgi:CBS domain containing-hemolysin-like protein